MCSIHSDVHCVSSSSRSHGSSLTNMDLTPSPVPSSTKHLPKTPTVSSIFHQATRSRKSLPGSNLRCDDGGKARIRQDWDQMTVSSQQLFIDAMEEAISRGFFQRFLQYHADLHSSIQSHLTCGFILWHRRFLLGMENMLRSLDLKYRCLTNPGMSWSIIKIKKMKSAIVLVAVRVSFTTWAALQNQIQILLERMQTLQLLESFIINPP